MSWKNFDDTSSNICLGGKSSGRKSSTCLLPAISSRMKGGLRNRLPDFGLRTGLIFEKKAGQLVPLSYPDVARGVSYVK